MLTDRDSHFFRIFRDSPAPLSITRSSDRRLVDINAAFTDLLGWGRDEVIGKTAVELAISEPDEIARIRSRLPGNPPACDFEMTLRTRSGETRDVLISIAPVTTSEGDHIVATYHDVTARKYADNATTRLAAIIESSEDAIAGTDLYGTITSWNAAAERIFGYSAEEMVGTSVLRIIPPERQDEEAKVLSTVRRGEGVHFETRRRTRDGQLIDVAVTTSPIRDSEGRIIGISRVARDITAKKRANMALVESNRRFHEMLANLDLIAVMLDRRGNITFCNAFLLRLTGWSEEEVIGRSWFDVFLPDGSDHVREMFFGTVDLGTIPHHYENPIRTRAGELRNVVWNNTMLRDDTGAFVGTASIGEDVTDRVRAEAAVRASEARYRSLFEEAPDGIAILDPAATYLDANLSLCRMLGYSRAEMIGMHVSDVVVPEQVAGIEPALETIRNAETHHRDWLARRKDGSALPVEVMSTLMPDGNLLAMIRDTTERNRSNARFRRLVDSNAQGVFFWNAAGEVTDANDAFLRIVGCMREDVDARRLNWLAMSPPEYAAADRRSLDEMAARGVCTPYEKEFIRKDGSLVPVLLGAATFEDDRAEGVSFVLDLTERKNLERQFLRAQRMESIGTLAGGIAHDLNNVLSPILLSVGILREEVKQRDLVGYLETLESSAKRGAALVQQVLSFARGVEGQHILVDLATLIRDFVKVMRDTFPKSVQVRFSVAEGLSLVSGDATQLHQVLLNLCVNARDAMPDGGTITIRLENVVLDETYAAMNLEARPGEYVRVTVTDTGRGIPPEVRDRIFEPFFTTKGVGQGTGLGLSTTLAIVKSHRGFINVYSEPGEGATFTVLLPAVRSRDAAGAPEKAPPLPRGSGELILVVDDEEPIRAIAQGTLERFGYQVMVASNGAEAVALYAQHRDRIAAVLTDMAMPIMDGPTTIVALKAINPAVVVIASSGLTSDAGAARVAAAGAQYFVPKPYTAGTILNTLHKALVEHRAGR